MSARRCGVDRLYQFFPAAPGGVGEELERLLRHDRLPLRRISELASSPPDEFLLRPATEDVLARGARHFLRRGSHLSWSRRLAFIWSCKVRSLEADVSWVRGTLYRYLELQYFFARFFASCTDRHIWERFGGGLDGVCVEFRADESSFLAESVRVDYLPRSAMRPVDLYGDDEREVVASLLAQRPSNAAFMCEHLWFTHRASNFVGGGAVRDGAELLLAPDLIAGVMLGQALEVREKHRILRFLRQHPSVVPVCEACADGDAVQLRELS